MRREQESFWEIVDQRRADLREAIIESDDFNSTTSNSWLQLLYEQYTSRFLADNTRIWQTGAIMIPLSFAGFAALGTFDDATRKEVIPVAFSSVAMIFSWWMIAENHRAFQNKSMAWIVAIEGLLGIPDSGINKVPDGRSNYSPVFSGAIRAVSRSLLAIVALAWIMVFIFWL